MGLVLTHSNTQLNSTLFLTNLQKSTAAKGVQSHFIHMKKENLCCQTGNIIAWNFSSMILPGVYLTAGTPKVLPVSHHDPLDFIFLHILIKIFCWNVQHLVHKLRSYASKILNQYLYHVYAIFDPKWVFHHKLWPFINIFNTLSVPNLKVHADFWGSETPNLLIIRWNTMCRPSSSIHSFSFLPLYVRLSRRDYSLSREAQTFLFTTPPPPESNQHVLGLPCSILPVGRAQNLEASRKAWATSAGFSRHEKSAGLTPGSSWVTELLVLSLKIVVLRYRYLNNTLTQLFLIYNQIR